MGRLTVHDRLRRRSAQRCLGGRTGTDYEPGVGTTPDSYTYIGAVYVRSGDRPLDIVDRVLAVVGLPPKTPLKVRGALPGLRGRAAPGALTSSDGGRRGTPARTWPHSRFGKRLVTTKSRK